VYLSDKRLVEPFAGGLAVSLGLAPDQAVLNDVNEHLINFYRWVQDGLIVELDFENSSEYYYAARQRFNALIESGFADSKESAELFYYLNRTGYNGLCRFNRRGQFNVPYGRYKKITYAIDFLSIQPTLASWDFTASDYQDIATSGDDLVYADPPYDVDFTSYSKSPFDWNNQVELAKWLVSLEVPVIASNQATPRILELYRGLGFQVHTLNAPRRISCNGDRTPASEMLATLRLPLPDAVVRDLIEGGGTVVAN